MKIDKKTFHHRFNVLLVCRIPRREAHRIAGNEKAYYQFLQDKSKSFDRSIFQNAEASNAKTN